MALCSLSIGTMVAPPRARGRISSSPASTSDSLFASSRRLPARAAASVDGRPAAPTIAATTVSQTSLDTSCFERVVAAVRLRRQAGVAQAVAQRGGTRFRSAMTACSGR